MHSREKYLPKILSSHGRFGRIKNFQPIKSLKSQEFSAIDNHPLLRRLSRSGLFINGTG